MNIQEAFITLLHSVDLFLFTSPKRGTGRLIVESILLIAVHTPNHCSRSILPALEPGLEHVKGVFLPTYTRMWPPKNCVKLAKALDEHSR